MSSAAPAGGVPSGRVAPDFDLPDHEGRVISLREYRGRPISLVFFDPAVPACRELAPLLGDLAGADDPGDRVVIIVTTGDPIENLRIAIGNEIRAHVVLQEHRELADQYSVTAYPSLVHIDAAGMVEGPPQAGVEAVLESLQLAESRMDQLGERPARTLPTKPLEASRLARNGLAPGTGAPGFQLPRVGGGTLDLNDYRGRRVLLVFSDPFCAPCADITRELESIHRQTDGLAVVMVSRSGDLANRRMIDAYGITYPIGRQRHWEVSQAYGMFATPIAYLLDEIGMIAEPVARGADDVRALALRAAQADADEQPDPREAGRRARARGRGRSRCARFQMAAATSGRLARAGRLAKSPAAREHRSRRGRHGSVRRRQSLR